MTFAATGEGVGNDDGGSGGGGGGGGGGEKKRVIRMGVATEAVGVTWW
jgi:hypothetical protein